LNLPNALTLLRIFIVPLLVVVLLTPFAENWVGLPRHILGVTLFLGAALTDYLDGHLARRRDQVTRLGQLLDPIADKLMLVTAFIVLSMRSVFPQPLPGHLPVPFWVTVAVISRDVFIIVGAAAINMMTGFKGFRPSWLGKLNTTVQIGGIAAIMFAASVPYYTGYYLPTVYAAVFALAILSGLHYIFFASKLMNEDRRQPPPPDDDLPLAA